MDSTLVNIIVQLPVSNNIAELPGLARARVRLGKDVWILTSLLPKNAVNG